MTQTSSYWDVPEQPSVSLLQECMRVPLPHPPKGGAGSSFLVAWVSLLGSSHDIVYQLEACRPLHVNLWPWAAHFQTQATNLYERRNDAADFCSQPVAKLRCWRRSLPGRRAQTFAGLVILATEGRQRLKAAAAPTCRTASYRDVVAFSWKGMSVTRLTFLHKHCCVFTHRPSVRKGFSHFLFSRDDRQADCERLACLEPFLWSVAWPGVAPRGDYSLLCQPSGTGWTLSESATDLVQTHARANLPLLLCVSVPAVRRQQPSFLSTLRDRCRDATAEWLCGGS